jgi:hypothetical protein
MDEENLAELLQFIRREGPYARFGTGLVHVPSGREIYPGFERPFHVFGHGILTYPDGNQQYHEIYAACRELECRGLIRRVRQEIRPHTAVVLFMPAPAQNPMDVFLTIVTQAYPEAILDQEAIQEMRDYCADP